MKLSSSECFQKFVYYPSTTSAEPTQSIMFLHPFFDRMTDLGIPQPTLCERLGMVLQEFENPEYRSPRTFLNCCSEQLGYDTLRARINGQMAQRLTDVLCQKFPASTRPNRPLPSLMGVDALDIRVLSPTWISARSGS